MNKIVYLGILFRYSLRGESYENEQTEDKMILRKKNVNSFCLHKNKKLKTRSVENAFHLIHSFFHNMKHSFGLLFSFVAAFYLMFFSFFLSIALCLSSPISLYLSPSIRTHNGERRAFKWADKNEKNKPIFPFLWLKYYNPEYIYIFETV